MKWRPLVLAVILSICFHANIHAQNLYVVNTTGNSRGIAEYDTNGSPVATFSIGLSTLHGLAFDANGNFYLAYNSAVAKFDARGILVNSNYITGLNSPSGVAFDTNGNFYVAGLRGTVAKYNTNGSLVSASFINNARKSAVAVAFGSDGSAYITDSTGKGLLKYSSTGTLLKSVTLATVPNGLAFDRTGNLYVGLSTAGTVATYDTNLNFIANFVTGLHNPYGLVFDANGNLYVSDLSVNSINEYDASGNLLQTVTNGVSGPGFLAMAAPIAPVVATPAITSPTANGTVYHPQEINGTENTNVLAVAGVYYSLNSGDWMPAVTANGWVSWQADPTNFIAGTNTLSVYAQDIYGGNSGTNTIHFVYNHIIYPSNNAGVTKPTITVIGTMDTNTPVAGVYCSLNGVDWTLATTTNNWYDWSLPVSLAVGTNTLLVYAQDIHGNNSNTNSVTFSYIESPVIYNFDNSSGGANGPIGSLVQIGNTLYGSASGTIFSMNLDGTGYQSFSGMPSASWGLIGSGNPFFGETSSSIFAVNADGTGLTTICSGLGNATSLVLSGTTLYCATDDGDPLGGNGPGTLFAVQTNGSGASRLHTFTGTDGDSPRAGLTLSGNTLYGTTTGSGANGSGTVFSINTDGTGFTVLANFPNQGITSESKVAVVGNMVYGTFQGNTLFNIFAVQTNGTGFTILYSQANSAGGFGQQQPGLIVSNNVIYGSISTGGAYGNGQIFQVQTNGTGFTVIYSFVGAPDGATPQTELLLAGHTLYGTTTAGGTTGRGTVFGLNVPDLTPDVFVAHDTIYSRNHLTTWQIKPGNLLTNAADSSNLRFALASFSTSTNGITLLNRHGYLQYYNSGMVDDQFTYTVTNVLGASATGTVTLTVAPPVPLGGQINHLTLTDGTATINFGGIANYLYQVQVSTNLTDWSTLAVTNAPANGLFQFTDPNPPQPEAFYRLRWSGN